MYEETACDAVALAVERFGTLNILVNTAGRTMNKGPLDTSVADWDGIVADSRQTLASYGHLHPLERVAQPTEIAESIAFLASLAASFIMGALVMAGGAYTKLRELTIYKFLTASNLCNKCCKYSQTSELRKLLLKAVELNGEPADQQPRHRAPEPRLG